MSEQSALSPPITFSLGDFLVRSFQAADRAHILRLHAAAAADSVDCECAAHIDKIEDKYLNQPRNHLWVADASGQIVGTIAICVDDQDVAHVHCLRAAADSTDHLIRKSLVQAAASHARLRGCLKLVVHAQVDAQHAAQILHRLGFEFSRHREIRHRHVLEFYLNLYESPELGTPVGWD